jgi:hypothetical protein
MKADRRRPESGLKAPRRIVRETGELTEGFLMVLKVTGLKLMGLKTPPSV